MNPQYTGDPNRVRIDGERSVVIGIGNIKKYTEKGSPLDIYQTHKHQTADNSTLLVGNSDFASSFTVKTAGLYAVNLNITILDEDEKPGKEHYIGLDLNGQTVLACLNGGFRCPENLDDSSKVRICNMNGILNLKESDRIQVKTMEANTTIRIETNRNSLLTMVLLNKH
ncbi:unnamed protein product [Lymnaea stagnalis]|uniref:Uncharacterized protein n=1 Tax=Lymnaea stagnalis TaxID=6523 RepID=A0AAV2HCL1_LYMST